MEWVGVLVAMVGGLLAFLLGRRSGSPPAPEDNAVRIQQRFEHEKFEIDQEAQEKLDQVERDRQEHLKDGKALLDAIVRRKRNSDS